MTDSDIEHFKQAAGEMAAAQLQDGMIVGLGSGTTATLAVAAIGRRVKEGLKITGIATSGKTAEQARLLNIPLMTLEDCQSIDLTIDGADEIESGTLNLIKGGGGNLLREKIVAVASARMLIVADDRKLVDRLGTRFALPVEIVPFGWQTTANRLNRLNARPTLRLRPDGKTFVTDGGHYILDCAYGPLPALESLAPFLDGVVGLVEHGLFIGIAREAFIGCPEGVKVLHKAAG
jgi:ribose 5-phosphate isomerase A